MTVHESSPGGHKPGRCSGWAVSVLATSGGEESVDPAAGGGYNTCEHIDLQNYTTAQILQEIMRRLKLCYLLRTIMLNSIQKSVQQDLLSSVSSSDVSSVSE
jgi:hypothetical protein